MAAEKPRIDVFISSTSIDLPEHRGAVRDAILNLGLFPSGMEHWPVSGENPVDLCHQRVKDAEIYLGIYAYRYGWTPEGYDGKSITELEYDWAGEVYREGKPIPRLCFVMADSHPWPEDQKEKDAQTELNRFKARVKENQVGFFTTPDDLKAQVIAALAGYAQRLNVRDLVPYLRWLHQQSKKSGLLQVLNPRDVSSSDGQISVDQVYTPLDTKRFVHRDDDGQMLQAEEILELKKKGKEEDDFELTPLTSMEAADLTSRLVVLGDPGSGKSTFVSYLALCLTGHTLEPEAGWLNKLQDQGWTQGEKLPIVITLRDFAQDIPEDEQQGSAYLLTQHLQHVLTRWNLDSALPALQHALDEGGALVLLDGLDEVPPQRRELVRETVRHFMTRYHPDNRYLVTCRILSYANPAWQIPGTASETLASFDTDKIEHFIQTWYAALQALGEIDPQTAEERVNDLTLSLDHPHLQSIASNPMLLTVMTVVHNHTGALPRESARLYDECIKLLMLRWKPREAQALKDELDVREDDLYRLLWEIAYDAHDKQAEREGAADISEAAILGIVRRRLGNDIARAARFTEYVEKRAGLLIGRGQDSYGLQVFTFPHRTFQEYLAGCHIAADRFRQHVPRLAERGAGWREVLLLGTGQLVFNKGDVATPLDAINAMCPARFDPSTETGWHKVWLAGEILLLVGLANVENDEVGREVLPHIQFLLAQLVSTGQLAPVERAAAGRALSQIGDPRRGVGLRPNGLPDIDWVDIPAGEFLMGSDKDKDPSAEDDELPQQSFYLEAYQISRYPITYAQFQAFVDAPDHGDNRWWAGMLAEGKDLSGKTYQTRQIIEQAFKYSNYPRQNVAWYQAIAFCRWLSDRLGYKVRLPTEAEWEKAARGEYSFIYPYGDEFDATKANVGETGIDQPSSVGMFPDGVSPYGVQDIGGNVYEWCITKWRESYAEAEDNTLAGDAWRVLRGGSWGNDSYTSRVAFRARNSPSFLNNNLGFRICRSSSS